MKKIVSVILCIALTAAIFVGCGKQESIKSDIVLITDGNSVNDDGYNQSAWEGVSSFADENSMTCRYYQPVLDNGELTVENVEKYVKLSSDNGAKFIVFPGEVFSVSAYEIAPDYPEISFILVDGRPHASDNNIDRFVNNVMCVQFDSSQAGFLAGYMSVITGNTKLGFFGEAGSKTSAGYGAGYVQGAAYAAEELGVPVTVDWADYDSPLLNYDYDFSVTACYTKIENSKDKTFKVNVENGSGSGTYALGSNVKITADPAPEGQEFDKWVVKSDTEGVKDKKVNISTDSDSTMNLLVEKCDCTITATYKDIEGDYVSVKVMDSQGKEVYSDYSVKPEGEITVTAPVAPEDMVFEKWETSSDLGEETDLTSKELKLKVGKDDIVLTPVYKYPQTPSFNVSVKTGEGGNGESFGSGSYVSGDVVKLDAAPPADGYMFSHWENSDIDGESTGIALENEFNRSTQFEMVDRYAAVCERMFNNGVTEIFDGGNSIKSAYTAKGNYDYPLNVISAGEKNNDALSTVVNDYAQAIKSCLASFAGGSIFLANCAVNGVYATYVSDDKETEKKYDSIYKLLAENKIVLSPIENGAGYDFCLLYNKEKPSRLLTLNGWFVEGVSLNASADNG